MYILSRRDTPRTVTSSKTGIDIIKIITSSNSVVSDIHRCTGLTLIVSCYRPFPKPEVSISLPKFSFPKRTNIFTRNWHETSENVTTWKTGSAVSKISILPNSIAFDTVGFHLTSRFKNVNFMSQAIIDFELSPFF